MPRIGSSQLDVFPLCLGGNVFGWTAGEREAFAVLDAYAAAGGNFIDTADSYTRWVEGSSGGESETIIGRWMASRGTRDRMVIATKVGKLPARAGLSAANIRAAADDSLRRLGTDRIDLYYAHEDDPATPIVETLAAFGELIAAGKVRYTGASNFTAPRLAEALAVSDAEGLPRYVALQPHHNLVERGEYRSALADLCVREGIGCVPYFALANGFLTGKYRPGTKVDSERAEDAVPFLDKEGIALLEALDEVAEAHSTTVAAVSLAWLAAEPAVVAPIASARTPEQVAGLVPMADLALTPAELTRLTDAHPGVRVEGPV